MVRLACSLLCLSVLSGCLWRVIDGDRVELNAHPNLPSIQYRLHGIDAPERYQTCQAWGLTWECGKAATAALETRTEGMVCSGNETDGYGRVLGTCHQDGENLNAWMVKQGWALAYREYSEDYVEEEDEAKAEKRGIHRGQFVNPWDWRKHGRLDGEDTFESFSVGLVSADDVEQLAHDLLWTRPVDFGGWIMEHSAFGLTGDSAVSFGDFRDTTPTGVGRVEWRGYAVAVNDAGTDSQGTAVIDIDDLEAPDVDVVLSGLPQSFTWTDAPFVYHGMFESEDSSMQGGFFGPQQEEVGGVFEQDGWTGAFGGTKTAD